MNFTVLGGGAIGTLYASRLAAAGHGVTVVARGARRQAIEEKGLVLRARRSGQVEVTRVPVVERLADAPVGDVIVVAVRAQQVDALMDALVSARGDVLTLVNTAAGFGGWSERLGARLIAGFPGAIATFDAEGVLTWEWAPRLVQPTMLGEPGGGRSERAEELAQTLRSAGVPVKVRTDMERWIRTHAAWMSPFMLTVSRGSEGLTQPDRVRRWMQATVEGLRAVRRSGPLSPFGFTFLTWLPVGLMAWVVRQVLRAPSLRRDLTSVGSHVADEGRVLATELLRDSPDALPSLSSLLAESTR